MDILTNYPVNISSSSFYNITNSFIASFDRFFIYEVISIYYASLEFLKSDANINKTIIYIHIKLFQSNWNNNFISVKYGVQRTFSLLVSTSRECLDQRQQELYFKELRHLDNHQEAKRWALAISSNYYTRSVKAAILFLSIFIISIGLK